MDVLPIDLPTAPAYELIGPDVAAELLASNTHNRRLDEARVSKLAAEMKEGRWRPTHQGIAVGRDGVLLDGQHRLSAVIKAGVTVTMLVTWDADPADFALVDVGRTRTAADVLGMCGVRQANVVAAAVRLLVVEASGAPRPWTDQRKALTPQAVDELYRVRYQGLGPHVRTAGAIKKRLRGSQSAFAAGLYVVCQWSEAQGGDMSARAEEWAEGIATGAGLGDGDARLALASWMAGSMRHLPAHHRAELLMMLVLRAWQAHVRGERMSRMVVRDPATYRCCLQ